MAVQCTAWRAVTAGSGGISGSYGGGIFMTGGRWTIQSTAEATHLQK